MFAMISWLVFGWLVGVVHKWLLPSARATTMWELVAVGVAGSVVGGLVQSMVSGDHYHPAGFVVSVVGACVAVWVYRNHLADLIHPPAPPEQK